jgi:hypothetical protein
LLLLITSLFVFNFIAYSKAPSTQNEFTKKNVTFTETSKLNSTITPIKTVENIELPIKWEQYSDFEELQEAKQIEVLAPSDLPKGFILQKTEYQHETIKGTYLNGKNALIFIQTPATNDTMNKEAVWKNNENETILTWSTNKRSFEIKGTNLNNELLNSFKQSLRPISNTTDIITLPFEIITSKLQLEKNNPKNRTFSLFTPLTFREFAKKQHIVIDKKWQAMDDEIIIGLFAGEKGSSGYAITTSQIDLKNNKLTVMFHETKPTPDMNYLTVITYPFQFIAIKMPPGKKISAVQFVSGKGEALASLIMNEAANP